MSRTFAPRGAVKRTVMLLSVGCAIALGGCGGSSSSTTTATRVPADAAPFVPVLLRGVVAGIAYGNVATAPAYSISQEKAAIAGWLAALADQQAGLRKLSVPARGRNAYNALLTANDRLTNALTALQQKSSLAAVRPVLRARIKPLFSQEQLAERSLRLSLGIPQFAWVKGTPAGSVIYSDSLSAPQGQVRWEVPTTVRYLNGGLSVSAPTNTSAITSPTTPYSYDARHVTVMADATVTHGTPFIGFVCPSVQAQPNAYAFGELGAGGTYGFILAYKNHPAVALGSVAAGSTAALKSAAVKPGASNRLRLDCDQFAPGLTTMRLYVNGSYIATAFAPVQLNRSATPGLLVVGAGGPATVVFKNWSVSKLPGS